MAPRPVALHAGTDALSRRHISSWICLSIAAGAVNAGGFIACERFVTHVTGTVTLIGMDFDSWWLMADYVLVLFAFIAGSMASVVPLQARAFRGKPPMYVAALVTVAVMLVATAVVGHMGAFGPVGGTVEEPGDFAFLCVLGFLMGLLNASVGTGTALAVRATHMTGPATDFGVHLATAWLLVGHQRKSALQWAALRGGKMFAFALGAGFMVPTMGAFGYLAFVMPAAFVTASLHSFLPEPDRSEVSEPALLA